MCFFEFRIEIIRFPPICFLFSFADLHKTALFALASLWWWSSRIFHFPFLSLAHFVCAFICGAPCKLCNALAIVQKLFASVLAMTPILESWKFISAGLYRVFPGMRTIYETHRSFDISFYSVMLEWLSSVFN